MSRSYKKTPWAGDKKGKKKKRIANHVIRQYLKRDLDNTLPNKTYKKAYCSWNICDYGSICSWKEYLRWALLYEDDVDLKNLYRKWRKTFRNK